MVIEMTPPSSGRLSALIRRCAASGALSPGAQLHAQALVGGRLPDTTLDTDLVLLYSRCGALHRAREVFDGMPSPSMHAYNVLLAASPPEAAVKLVSRLVASGLRPDRYSVPAVLRACAESRDALLGSVLHGFAVRLGLLANVVVSGALLDMYAKTGTLGDAGRVFDEMPERDAVAWNCMVTGYARAGRSEETLELFRKAQVESAGMARDLRAVPSVLNVCADEGQLMKGREIHGRMARCLASSSDTVVGNALIDMYGKCGQVDGAQAVFASMEERDVVSWSSLISCYGVHGMGKEALRVYEEMVSVGVKPNCVTFVSILSSCSHSGLVSDGRRIFESMRKVHAVEPTADHYACMVDLLGRAGAIEEAVGLVNEMPMEPGASLWGALLSACAIHNNVDVGEVAAYRLFELEEDNASNYVTLCGIYDAIGRSDSVAGLRSRMRELGMVKTPGCSWVHVKGRAYAFYQGCVPRYLRRQMLRVLGHLLEDMAGSGYENEHLSMCHEIVGY